MSACWHRTAGASARQLARSVICRAPVSVGVEAAAAGLAVALVAADADLLAFADALAVVVDAHVHRRLLAAGADVLDFLDVVGQRQQVGRTGERVAAEVAAQAVADHRHAAHLRQLVQLLDLGGGEELGFVDQHAGDLRRLGQEIGLGAEGVDLALRAEARGDLADAVAAVDGGGVQLDLLALLFVVVRHLQQCRRFAGVHRRIPEIEFCHCACT